MKFEIKSRWGASILFSLETGSLKLCLEAAIKGGADLGDADLRGADLGDGADKLTLFGERPLLQLGPLGSRNDVLLAFLTDRGVYLRAGCFSGSLEAFRAAVLATHGPIGVHAEEYTAAVTLIELHAKLWTPAVAKTEAA